MAKHKDDEKERFISGETLEEKAPPEPKPVAGGVVTPTVQGGPPSAGAIEAYPEAVQAEHMADNSENEHRRVMKEKAAARKA